mgnify:CR=1 FL=1
MPSPLFLFGAVPIPVGDGIVSIVKQFIVTGMTQLSIVFERILDSI